MLQIIRAPSGGWERDPVTGDRGRQLWHNVRGRRTLTNYGRNLPALRNWEDVVVHIPVIERQMGPAAADRPFDARAKNTYYPVSEETVPGMLAQLMAGLVPPNTLANMMAFPPGFRAWVMVQLTGGIGGEIDRGSDRVWDYDPTGAWHMSVQSVNAAGQLQTRLPDRPMAGTVLVYDDIQYHWHLSKTAYSESDGLYLCHGQGFSGRSRE